ncbi:MAG: hypothetical protein A2534_03210 [Candidatus Magasanikbacteria bacterium RIFOXYD2_FULL_39_9]|uniref:Baseplate protein J-like domain-containing protein n=1 Tax=Candidatus Magasanikbacteria bacterium RIFOXYD1_FULL_40_23 TaxID=1798705 RepID=A0A1F6PAA5_9BACT|nr:MAG: hypothetical protein A2534_03210 [Candidatus Magasanikbacteria bacterium RIFOXYD2_FULL_39_9]OGH93099.1 MAG: hypothetical protein A2563_00215 [Candidatus Magasanikbacteria bacterium RIFOXYD1_FULL_40_23]
MITHRVATRLAPEPPVRFYRTIAVTFLIVTLLLLGVIIFFTSKKATIVIVAKTDNKNINLDIGVANQKTGDLSIVGIVTTTKFHLSQKYSPTGNKTTDGIATGEVTLFNETNAPQTLVKTTRLLTSAGVLFRLSDRVSIPAKGQVQASVYADQLGASGNISASKFTIPGLAEDKQKVIYASSNKEMSGGVRTIGVLSAEDLKSAKSDFANKVKQTVEESLEDAGSFGQKLIFVPDNNVAVDRQIGEEITEFNLSGTSTVVIVYYNKDDLKSILAKEVSDRVDASTEKVLSVSKEPQVTLGSYDIEKQKGQLSVYQDVLVTLDVNGEKLMVNNFFGKKKDEIERYVFGLGHVVGVDVKFSPGWMRSAPSVAEKVQVVVKNVE